MRRLAAVDVGTNTVRLLVADAEGDTLIDVDRGQVITRLGTGVDATGRLDPVAVERTIEAMAVFVARARELGAEDIRAVGTSALRDAVDRDLFVVQVAERTGQRLDILTGEEEGALAYLGATLELSPRPWVVCDIGGGSTELITAERSVSMEVGSVRLRERYLHSDPPRTAEIEAARETVTSELARRVGDMPGSDAVHLAGVAGTITTLAALAAGLETYERATIHRSHLSRADVEDWSRRLNEMTVEAVRGLGPVEAGRADVLGAGALICLEVMRHLEADELTVSERDLLDGCVLGFA